jgi:NAD(P)-dependent dehydrogenase (short-subunit alcohol dehydrogenase family)
VGGQGRAAAIRFAQEGARIVGADLKEDGAAETVELVRALGGDMVSRAPVDLADEDAVSEFIDFGLDAFGDFDVLYNNAGAQRLGSIESQTVENFNYTLTHEITLLFAAIKHAIPVFKRKGGGSIINTASIGASMGSGWVGNIPGMLSHSIGKAGVIRLSSVLAVELSPLNIRVNSISPGIIETPGSARIIGTEDEPGPLRQDFVNHLLVPRIGRPEDIANAALYLASDEAAYVTGINLVVDGGWTATGGVGRPQLDVAAKVDAMMAAFARGEH